MEFDAGHRIPHHGSQCRNLHGHRYVIEITLAGKPIATDGAADEGMVLDFSEIKSILKAEIVDPWDHAFIVFRGDTEVREFLENLPGHKTVVLDLIPTAENLAAIAFRQLKERIKQQYGERLHLERVRLYETPNCWADAVSDN